MAGLTIQQQFEQSMTLLAWYRNNPGASLTRASRELSMTVPQIRHELRMLMLCGLPQNTDTGFLIDINIGPNSAYVRQDLGINRPINLSIMEAGVLLLSLESVRSTLPADRRPAVDSAAEKIRQLMNQNSSPDDASERYEDEELDTKPEEDSATAELADLLNAAIVSRALVDCEYLSLRSDSIHRRTLIPDHLGLVEGHLYLWARDVVDGVAAPSHKAYRLERMQHIALGKPGSAEFAGPRKEPHIDADNPFNFAEDAPWVSLHLSEQAQWMLEYYPMWHEENPKDRDATGIDVAFPDTGIWTERFLIANADWITVNTPESLSERVRRRATNGLSAYSRDER